MTRRTYTQEFKDEAADYVISTGLPIAQVSRDLGLGEQMLGRWVKARKSQSSPAPASKEMLEKNAEIKSLKRQVGQLEEEMAILKKAAAFFAKSER